MTDFKVQHIQLSNGINIAFDEIGAGEQSMVLVHGMDSNRKAWKKNLALLGRHFHCLALDFPNHGDSQKGQFSFDTHFFAEVLHRFCAARALEKPILVGHSMGGQAVLRCLIDHPERYEKAVLIAPAGLETFSEDDISALEKMYTAAAIRNLSDAQIQRNVRNYFDEFPEDARFMLEERLALREAPHFEWHCEMIPQCVFGMVKDPVHHELHRIQARVLVLFGENDRLIPHPKLHGEEDTSAMASREAAEIPGAELQLFPRTGHFLQWEQAEAFHAAVLEFLRINIVNPDLDGLGDRNTAIYKEEL